MLLHDAVPHGLEETASGQARFCPGHRHAQLSKHVLGIQKQRSCDAPSNELRPDKEQVYVARAREPNETGNLPLNYCYPDLQSRCPLLPMLSAECSRRPCTELLLCVIAPGNLVDSVM